MLPLPVKKSGGRKSKIQPAVIHTDENEQIKVTEKGQDSILEECDEALDKETLEVINSVRTMFNDMASKITDLEKINADLRNTSLEKRQTIFNLEKENSELRVQLNTAISKQNMYEESQKILYESFEKFRNICTIDNLKNANETACTPVRKIPALRVQIPRSTKKRLT